MNVDSGTAAVHREHEGATYYFCSEHCAASFTSEPHKFVNALGG